MRSLVFVAMLPVSLLGACSPVENGFSISDPNGTATAAELRLCGEMTALRKSGQHFSGSLPITCEGDGQILVRFADGRTASCLVGYVTPGMVQQFDFVIEESQCFPKAGAA